MLPTLETIKDLGVLYDSKLTFDSHIDTIVNDACRNLGFIIRIGREFKQIKTLQTLFYSYVRSKLEYANLVWNPHNKIDLFKIERVQTKFLRYLTYKETGVYPQREHTCSINANFNFMTLEHRRILQDMLFLYKLFHKMTIVCYMFYNHLTNSPP